MNGVGGAGAAGAGLVGATQVAAVVAASKLAPSSVVKEQQRQQQQHVNEDDYYNDREERWFPNIRTKAAGLFGCTSMLCYIANSIYIIFPQAAERFVSVKWGVPPIATRIVSWIAAGFAFVSAPTTIRNEHVLSSEQTYREALGTLSMHVDAMKEENVQLTSEIDVLQRKVQTMKEIEEALGNLADQQGSDLNRLMDLIKENRKITDQQREYLKAKAVEDAIALVLEVDRDGSFFLDAQELDQLILGLRLIEMIELDEVMFRQRVEERGGDVRYVLRLIRNILVVEEEEEEAARRRGTMVSNVGGGGGFPGVGLLASTFKRTSVFSRASLRTKSQRHDNVGNNVNNGPVHLNHNHYHNQQQQQQHQAIEDAQVMRARTKRDILADENIMKSMRDSRFFTSTRNVALKNLFSDIE